MGGFDIHSISRNYEELRDKTGKCKSRDSLYRFKIILDDLREVERKMKEAIINIDRGRVSLTTEELTRIEEDDLQDRILERVKPFMLLSQMLENLENGQSGQEEKLINNLQNL
tara:strand:+ start:6257 stop:6595 length:339 start_codon:yes stop_codon:yes gene_type:complete